MSDESPSAEELVSALADNEGNRVTLHFEEPITIPTEGYNGHSYSMKELDETSVHVEIETVDVEDLASTLICFAEIAREERARLGINPDAVEDFLEIFAQRDTTGTSAEEAEQAISDGDTDALGDWERRPVARVPVKNTDKGAKRHVESGYSLQTSPPDHEIGTICGVGPSGGGGR